ncbi:MAG: Ig-like domain-containing protein [Muribaculaceae bacterium]|nr:Ig-like domain-containing protein [Muribaculaceae bacterium]
MKRFNFVAQKQTHRQMKRHYSYMHVLVAVVLGAAVTACASIGRPQGGPRDEEPPKFVHSNPRPGQLNFQGNRISIVFDENIQLDDAFNKVVVSPVQTQPPAVSSNGKRVSIEMRDTMQPNTTYSIDFGDAIKDLNEGNVLDGFAIDFSTGETIDTLRISGMVLEARTLEPAQGMLVGVHSNLDDSAITTLPFDRIARTNQYGQFTIRNLKPGTYRVFALNDMNRDYKWDRSEDIAFYDFTVSPSIENIEVCDTFLRDDGTDSVVTHGGIKYLPNDVLLTWFNEGYSPQYMKDYSRPERRKVTLNFAAASDTLPVITIADGAHAGRHIDDWAVAQINPTRDSLVYWIRDTAVIATDSLRLSIKYLKTDTAEQLSWQTDTLRFFFREPKSGKKKKSDEEKDSVITDAFGVPQPKDFLNLTVSSGNMDVYAPIVFQADQPVDTFIESAIKLEMQVDTLWERVAVGPLTPDSLNPLMKSSVAVDWVPGAKYRISVDSAAVTGIYGVWNKPVQQNISVRDLSDYSNLVFNISGLVGDSVAVAPAAFVELLGSDDKPVRVAPVVDGRAEFKYLQPSTYFARLYIDANDNGKWDTGFMNDKLQPEEVFYYSKKLQLKKNWDIEQSWDIYEYAVDAQKPEAIKKNKPKTKKGDRTPRRDSDEEEEYDEFGNPIDGNNLYDRNDPNNLSNRRPSGNMNTGNGLRGQPFR